MPYRYCAYVRGVILKEELVLADKTALADSRDDLLGSNSEPRIRSVYAHFLTYLGEPPKPVENRI